MRHRCSQLFHHLSAVWISSHGRLQTLNAEQERVPQRQSFLEIFAGMFHELDHILMKQCQSRILICLSFFNIPLVCVPLTSLQGGCHEQTAAVHHTCPSAHQSSQISEVATGESVQVLQTEDELLMYTLD